MTPFPRPSLFRHAFVLALALWASVGALAASFSITKAEWKAEEARLRVAGTGPKNAVVLILDAASGSPLATTTVKKDETWKVDLQNPPFVPCRVRAQIQGGPSLERNVKNAPANCGAGVSLLSLSISGPTEIPENSTAAFTATARFSDGSTQDVTSAASWSEDSPYASISAGLLSAGEVPSDQTVTVSASYAFGGVTRSASRTAVIKDILLVGSHVGRFTVFEGTRTCLQCHENEARAFHGSVHYQWKGDASEAEGLNDPQAGKLGGINDFCIYPDINWLGKLTNVFGVQVDGGCARCHTGLGQKPDPNPTQAQLENIDCLLCHAPQYRRKVELVNGQWRMVPDLQKMGVTLLQAAVDIHLPSSDTCLNCHTRAGGGNNYKRGDLSEAHRAATPALDIHMAPTSQGGAGLSCLDCHQGAGHRIPGRGIDLRERDVPTVVACSNCHGTAPHDSADINKHLKRVDCTTCHIPTYAKGAPTDMVRDWSQPGDLDPVSGLFEPHMTKASNVTPVYGFFNGRSRFYQFGAPAVPGSNGKVLMAGPLGSVQEPGAKIVAMKRHEGKQPMDPVTQRLYPLKIGIFFQSGDVDTAVAQGAAAVGWTYNGHTFAETERYMGLYHEVAGHDQALSCATCHDQNRLDFAALGYTPLSTRNGRPLCSSCHEAKSNPGFYNLHNKHVKDKKLDCSNCHTFSKAQ